MKRPIALLFVVVVAAVATACGPKPGPQQPLVNSPPPPPAEVIAKVKAQIEQYRQSYEVRSMEALAPLYSQTDDLVVTVQGRTLRGWPQVQDGLATFCQTMVLVKLRLSDVSVVALGDAGAVVSATVQRTYGDGVKTVDESGTLTLVFRRVAAGTAGGAAAGTENEWKIAAEHYSYAPVNQ